MASMKTLLSLLVASSFALSVRAADTNSAAVGISQACKPELRSVCKPKKGSSPLKCLKEHKAEASPACQAALDGLKGATVPEGGAKAGAATAGKSRSCVPEFEKVCKGAKSGELNTCLKAHLGELSEFCRKVTESILKKD